MAWRNRVEVSYSALRQNVAVVKSLLGDKALVAVGKADAYKLEAGGITLFSRIECKDHNAITGLPLMALIDLLAQFGLHP